MKRLLLLAILPALSAGCALTSPQEDPVLVKLNELERRLATIERVLGNGSLVELTMQAEELHRQTAALQGRVESLEHNSEGTAARQRDLYVDLDERIRTLEESMVGATTTANVMDGGTLLPGQLPVPGGSDQDNYRAAFELLKEQRYEPAAMAFDQFLISFPDSQLAENAQYWLAESYYVTGEFEKALADFERVIREYPGARKVPDALLKMGYCNYELGRWEQAKAALTKVTEDHADTTAARLADQRLKRIAEEGH
ncbi:MAG: tol-pal system protein YbgF [Gammaproteobacteria bacterium]|nr:tol-pal system protein YbgF [Gammaproteobacteria bacterium]